MFVAPPSQAPYASSKLTTSLAPCSTFYTNTRGEASWGVQEPRRLLDLLMVLGCDVTTFPDTLPHIFKTGRRRSSLHGPLHKAVHYAPPCRPGR